MLTRMVHLSRARARSILLFVFLILLLSNTAFARASTNDSSSLRSDANDDGVVDVYDIAILANAYGSYPGHPRWNWIVDFNDDKVVDMIDLVLLAMDLETTARTDTESETTLAAEFLSGFHTGCYWSYIYSSSHQAYSTWNPVLEGGYIKWTMRQTSCKLNPDGTTTGNFPDSKIRSTLNTAFADNLVPVIEFTRVVNLEDAQKSWWDNFFNKWGDWMATNHPGKFFILSPASEFNYPDGMEHSSKYNAAGYPQDGGPISRQIDDTDYPACMQKIREARDDAGLQDVIKIAVHANIGWWACDTLNEMSTNWDGFYDDDDPDYIDGMAYADIMGMSHYMAYEDSSHNPSDASWQTTLQYSWERCKRAWEMVNALAGKTLPFLFFEYAVGHPWRDWEPDMKKAEATYTYTQMVQNNPWCKGILWYVNIYIEPDAKQELVRLAEQYNGYD